MARPGHAACTEKNLCLQILHFQHNVRLSGDSPSLFIDSVFDDCFQDVVLFKAEKKKHKTNPSGMYCWFLKGLVLWHCLSWINSPLLLFSFSVGTLLVKLFVLSFWICLWNKRGHHIFEVPLLWKQDNICLKTNFEVHDFDENHFTSCYCVLKYLCFRLNAADNIRVSEREAWRTVTWHTH